MMKKFIFALFVLVASAASAQNGITNDFRFGQGEDSLRCIETITIVNVNLNNKDYATAYTAWKTIYNEFPVARVDTYSNGIKLLTELIKKESDPAKKNEYVKELMVYTTSRSSTSTSSRRSPNQSFQQVTSLAKRLWPISSTTRTYR